MNFIFERIRLNKINRLFFCLVIASLISPNLFSQTDKKKPPEATAHHEVKNHNYVPMLKKGQQTSPAYNYFMDNIVTVQVNVDENGNNIIDDAANEPSIAIDPNDHNKMAIGWRQFNSIKSDFREAGYGFSTNGGATWTFPGVIEPGVFRSDPVLRSDKEGIFYYNSLTNNPTYICHVFRSTDGGSSWDSKTYAQGGDKQWMTIDQTSGSGAGNIYASWTSYYSVCTPGFFTRSTDKAMSFEECIEITGDPYWGQLAVGPDGELYAGGSTGYDFLVAKSLDAKNAGEMITWVSAEVVNLDGNIAFGGGPNPGGLMGQTSLAVDTSGGPYHGSVYLLCSVQRNSVSDPLDVMFVRSTDGGINWSPPVRINDDKDTTAYQWFGTMSVAPNGRIDVVWLDTRGDNPGTYLSALYYSNSKDGGVSWLPNLRLSDYFDPHLGWPLQQKMGDYFDMHSDNKGAFLAWAATFTGGQDIYYSYITAPTLPADAEDVTAPSEFILSQNYPNPFNPNTSISYNLPVSGYATLKVYDVLGNEAAVLVSEYKSAGNHDIKFNAAGLGSGVYFYTLISGSFSDTKKMVLVK